MKLNRRKFCECGCGELVKSGNRFVHNHHKKGTSIKHSEETKRKMSLASQGENNHFFGKKHTDEWKKRVSSLIKGRVLSDLHKQRIGLGRKGKYHTEESNEKNRQAHLGLSPSEETREKQSKIMMGIWECMNEEERHEWISKIRKSGGNSPNKLEKKLLSILENLYPGEWKFVGDGEVVIAGKCPDFINVNGQKKIIELFGDYWHAGENPNNRIEIFRPYGYETLVIWEGELKDMEKVKVKINEFTKQK